MKFLYQALMELMFETALKNVCEEMQKKKKRKNINRETAEDTREDSESSSSVVWILFMQTFTDIIFQTSCFLHHKKKLIFNSDTIEIVKILTNINIRVREKDCETNDTATRATNVSWL